MPLSEEQKEKARRFFLSNGVVPDCPYCGTGGWEAAEIVLGRVADGEGEAAMVQYVCNNCGHVALFDAERLGLIDR